jgi:hypothetical protein
MRGGGGDAPAAEGQADPKTKSFTMSVASGRGLSKLREEAKKCVLVCANCHGEIESGVVPSPPAGARYAHA